MQTSQKPIHTGPPILTVSQLTDAIKHCLEATFPFIWLKGEISNLKIQSSGHLYFSLKDANAQISAVMFRGSATTLKSPPKDGTQVMVQGDINVYPPSGKYQIVVRELRLVGIGELLQKLEELKAKLHAQGWFNPAHKKPLPKFPNRIGVVTSPTGAAIHDILNVLSRRFSGFRLLLNPVRVQGEGSAEEIAKAIRFFNEYHLADVLIIGRGGGSIEDLWAFNEEIVAEAIYTSKIPIISAVGHETDVCLSDFVADIRAPTPSAAAMMVIAEKEHQLQRLQQLKNRMLQTLQQLIKHDRQKLLGIMRQPRLSLPYGLMGVWLQRSDDLRQNIDLSMRQSLSKQRTHLNALHRQMQLLKPTARIAYFRQKLDNLEKGLLSTITNKLLAMHKMVKQADVQLITSWRSQLLMRQKIVNLETLHRQIDYPTKRAIALQKGRLQAVQAGLQSTDPKNVLKRGYSILFNEKDGCVITTVTSIRPGQNIKAIVADGKIGAVVNEVLEQ